jgi:hypothetical protein
MSLDEKNNIAEGEVPGHLQEFGNFDLAKKLY